MELLLKWDSALFLQLNAMHSAWWDTAMLFFTRKESWLPLYLMLLILIIRNYKGKSWLLLIFLVLGLVVSDQVCNILKEIVERYRPGYDPSIKDLTHIVLRKGGEYGFPSSHAANTFFMMTFTGFLFRNRISLIMLLIWALLVSYSRIYVGAHFPLDILAGWTIGILTGWLFYKLMTWVETKATGSRRQAKVKPLPDIQAGLLTLVFVSVLLTLLTAVYILHKYNFL
jgi:undecaprenyl-diphosphatase